MLAPGQEAPAFEGTDQAGARFSSRELSGRSWVLFFYPKAGSAGCTVEVQGFSRLAGPLRSKGVALVGVSVDSPLAQRRFSEKCQLSAPLLADQDRTIARAFGALGLFGLARRVTFLVSPEGKVEETVRSPFPGVHVRRVTARFLEGGGDTDGAGPAPAVAGSTPSDPR